MQVPYDQSQSFTLLDRWYYQIIIFVWLALVTSSISFTNQHYMPEYSSGLQREIWTRLQVQGEAGQQKTYSIWRANCTRILVPAVMASIVNITGLGWDRALFLVRFPTIFATYLLFYHYNRKWFNPIVSLTAVLFLAATISLTLITWFEVPTDFVEILTYTLGLWCIREHRDLLLCFVIFVGTLSRETTMFLPLILLACRIGKHLSWSVIKSVTLAGLSWSVPFILLRWWTGLGLDYNHGDSFAHNLVGLRAFLANFNPYNHYLYYLYLYGIFWFLPFLRWQRQPLFFRRALLTLPVFLVVYIFFGGFLNEPREIVNLYPLLVPAGMFSLSDGTPTLAYKSVQ